jgi:hypothetical protein
MPDLSLLGVECVVRETANHQIVSLAFLCIAVTCDEIHEPTKEDAFHAKHIGVESSNMRRKG